ncbi:hypothetical protein ACHAWU_008707 [Discostella pseudostelligera]|uniref:DOMON domain-containing protein n=1 Tax=Discostella pseudostelligera TaxID=259834 RepID=A0ABD3M873_9STRA
MVCPEYSSTSTQLNKDQLTFYHSEALAPEGDSRIGLLCGKLELNDGSTGSGYIGFGISPDGEMPNSVGIVGLPDTDTVEKYWLMDGYVERMSDDKQTLLYTTIGQDQDGTPYMEFAKFLYEEEELPILANGDNTFLFALGESSELAYHSAGEGAFTLDLETPASNATTTSDATVTGASSTLTASTTFGIEGGAISTLTASTTFSIEATTTQLNETSTTPATEDVSTTEATDSTTSATVEVESSSTGPTVSSTNATVEAESSSTEATESTTTSGEVTIDEEVSTTGPTEESVLTTTATAETENPGPPAVEESATNIQSNYASSLNTISCMAVVAAMSALVVA